VIAIAPDALRLSARLVAEVRIPEKEILQRVDTELKSDALQLPIGATLYRANIKLAVSAKCKDAAPGTGERSANVRIYVDTGLACRPPREIVRSGSRLLWVRAEEADRTEIAFLGADDGRELRRLATGDLSLPITDQAAAGVIAVLRSRCGTGYSAPSFVFLR
jgi:hypothetical protein